MQRRTLLTGAAATLAATPLARPHAQKPVTVRWWYHFDDPKATPDELVAAFEKENPGIKIQAENIPWGGGGDYDNRLYTSIIAGNGPDTAMVKFNNLARLMEMDALTPLDKWIDAWPGKSDISADLWRLHTAPDGKRYYMPLQYVVLYLYVRLDLLAKQNLQGADELRRVPDRGEGDDRRRAVGLRHARRRRRTRFVDAVRVRHRREAGEGRLRLAGRRWRRTASSSTCTGSTRSARPRRPTDAFLQIVNNMKAGRTAMTVHHISSANDHGRRRSATRSPRCRCRAAPNGSGWATFGDGSNARVQREQEPGSGVEVGLLAVHRRRTTCCSTRPPDR